MYKVAVIGAGVIGLTTAVEIQEKLKSKVSITIFTEKLSPYTTGDIAAGLWTPYLLQETPKEKIIKWSETTQEFLLHLWKNGLSEEAGISLFDVETFSEDKDFKLPEWLPITFKYRQFAYEEIDDFNTKFSKKFTGGYTYKAFTWEPSKFLPLFKNKFQENGGKIVLRKIQSFSDLKEFDVIVNCSGLNSRILVPDPLVKPIRGQIVRVKAPFIKKVLMIDSDEGHYIIPNKDCVILGGTHQENDFSTVPRLSDKEFILEGCCNYIKELKQAPVIEHQVGLRPGRKEVRIDLENRKVGEKVLKIVHNYGHGGSGITLCIGCAKEAAELVKVALERSKL